MTKEDQQALYNNTVIPLIKESGFDITLSHPTTGPYDPDTGSIPGVPVESFGWAIEDEAEADSVPSSLAGKVAKTILAIEINEPEPVKDRITFKGQSFQVLGIEPLEPGEVLFFYTMYLGA